MKKKMLIPCIIGILLVLLGGGLFLYWRTLGAPVIGTIHGPEWDVLTVDGVSYERTDSAPVHGTDKGKFLGIATSGDTRFRIYEIPGYDSYLYGKWDWEGFMYERVP